MIGDVLHHALEEIERYQRAQATSSCYEAPEVEVKIAAVTASMRDLLRDLDAPPTAGSDAPNGETA